MSKGPFVSLHNHTELGSPLDGMNDTYDLFLRAKEVDHPAVAITDHGTMTAHLDAYKASQKTGVKFIPGMEAYFTDDLTSKKNYHLVLLAKNAEGYKNLLRLNFDAYKNKSKGFMGAETPRVSWEHLDKYSEGLFALTACSNGVVGRTLISDQDEDLAIKYMLRLQNIFKDRFFLELQPHALYDVSKRTGKEVNQVKLNEALLKYSKDYNIPYVITCDAHYRDKEHANYHDFMLAIKEKKSLNDPDRFRYGVQDMYLKTHEEIVDFFGGDVATLGMENTIKIMDACDEPSYMKPKGPILPAFPVHKEANYEEFKVWHEKADKDLPIDKSYLRYRCIKGLEEKFPNADPKEKQELWERVKKEISVLEDKNFSSYMLIVSDYINWAKSSSISVGPARGSAAGSLVAYIIGITKVNPMEYGLIFERFHNSEKKSFPDIDTDFAKPALVKEYISTKYGTDYSASISNWSTLSPKVIIKDVARTLEVGGSKGAAFAIANRLNELVPNVSTIEEAMRESDVFAEEIKKYPEIIFYCKKLQGLTRNYSTHAAGIVLSDVPLNELIPLRIDKEGMIVSQWEKTRIEEFGLVKFDILGLNTLNVIEDALANINERKSLNLTMDDVPLDDTGTYDMISEGNTAGVFQLESSLTPLCMKIKPHDIETISDINALGRPSCSASQRESYINRRFGKEEIKLRHPSLSSALSKTYGISLYEEGMMRIAADCAGWDLNQADALRKITKSKGKDPKMVKDVSNNFVNDSVAKTGMSARVAKEIWQNEIEPFGEYGFNKSHSVSYSIISYITAWIKNNYPVDFMCSLLNNKDPNSDKTKEYLAECSRMKINIIQPDVSKSNYEYNIVNDNTIVTGFKAIKGVGDKAIQNIIDNQPYEDFSDFIQRTEARIVNKKVLQSLAKAGAFDSFDVSRKDIYDNYDKYRKEIKKAVDKGKRPVLVFNPTEWGRKDLLLNEKLTLGRTFSGSLHEVYSDYFTNDHLTLKFKDINKKLDKQKVRVEAIVSSKMKEISIKKGKNIGKKIGKYLVEDNSGTVTELTLWPDDYIRYNAMLEEGIPFKAVCTINDYNGNKTIVLSDMINILGRTY